MIGITEQELETLIDNAVIRALSKVAIPTIKQPEELLMRKQVCALLAVSLSTLNNLTKAGKIKASRIGRRVLYKRCDVDAALMTIQASNLKDN